MTDAVCHSGSARSELPCRLASAGEDAFIGVESSQTEPPSSHGEGGLLGRKLSKEALLTASFVKSAFDYCPECGLLTWKNASIHTSYMNGSVAGNLSKRHGYRMVSVGNRPYMAHRLIWLWMTGSWPQGEVDHRNLIKSDNRWANLRLATVSQNRANRTAQVNNRSGFKGVYRINARLNPWKAFIKVNREKLHLGVFGTAEQAARAYDAAALKHFGSFARLNFPDGGH